MRCRSESTRHPKASARAVDGGARAGACSGPCRRASPCRKGLRHGSGTRARRRDRGAAKAGVVGMVLTIAAENVRHGITANAVLPGLVATEQVRAMPPEVMRRWLEVLPAGRLIEPEEVAALIAFLASPAAGSITGEALGIDGGMHLSTVDFGSKRRV